MKTTKWTFDPAHTEILFKVKHLMITNITGRFDKFSGEVETEENNFETAKVRFSVETASVNSGSAQRDGHLKGADFFDVENFSEMKFESTQVEPKGDDHFKLSGNLTIKDITQPVELDVEMLGIQKDPWGVEKAGFSVNGKINRKLWQLNWNAALESGGMLVGDEVRINCEVQLVKATVPEEALA